MCLSSQRLGCNGIQFAENAQIFSMTLLQRFLKISPRSLLVIDARTTDKLSLTLQRA